MLLYTQDIQVVNFSDMYRGFVNVIIMYKDVEGRSVKLEAMGNMCSTGLEGGPILDTFY